MPILKVFLFQTVKYPIVPVCYLPFIQNNLYPLRNNQVNLMFLFTRNSAALVASENKFSLTRLLNFHSFIRIFELMLEYN